MVVQHIPLGGLLEWNTSSSHTLNQSIPPTSAIAPPSSSTAAPWASNNIPAEATPAMYNGTARNLPTAGFPTSTGPMSIGTSFVLPRSDVPHQSRRAALPSLRNQGPIVSSRMPLGPLASTALRPSQSGVEGRSVAGGPTTTNSKPPTSSGDD